MYSSVKNNFCDYHCYYLEGANRGGNNRGMHRLIIQPLQIIEQSKRNAKSVENNQHSLNLFTPNT